MKHHNSQARNPATLIRPMLATALNREIVAIDPLSWYSNSGGAGLPVSRAWMTFAAYRAPWIATCATPG